MQHHHVAWVGLVGLLARDHRKSTVVRHLPFDASQMEGPHSLHGGSDPGVVLGGSAHHGGTDGEKVCSHLGVHQGAVLLEIEASKTRLTAFLSGLSHPGGLLLRPGRLPLEVGEGGRSGLPIDGLGGNLGGLLLGDEGGLGDLGLGALAV